MSIVVPVNCTNPVCRETAIRPIHRSSRVVANNAALGPPVFSHHNIYRCSQCGHTWAVQGYSAEENVWPMMEDGVATTVTRTFSRGW